MFLIQKSKIIEDIACKFTKFIENHIKTTETVNYKYTGKKRKSYSSQNILSFVEWFELILLVI